jgi:hypothetical protein
VVIEGALFSTELIFTVHLLSEANVISVSNNNPAPLVTKYHYLFLRNTLMMMFAFFFIEIKDSVCSSIFGL